ncbi:MAG: MoxR family ATPase [Frankia sp.]|nr:MoxR family ATPase [Frankia sp.]
MATEPGVLHWREPAGDVNQLADVADRIRHSVESVIDGKPQAIRTAIIVLLAEGHLLIEDVPGVGKTMLAKSLARSLDARVRRIQFTPDLLPGDVTGVSVYNQGTRDFEFRPGPVFANIVIGDEINRAHPKAQSALLECMEEQQVTVDGVTYRLEQPFLVVATQNPVEMEGTQPLPEAQRDRFMARISMGYPSPAAELNMLDNHGNADPLDDIVPVTSAAEIVKMISLVRKVHVSVEVRQYIVDLVGATRRHPEIALGASPRGALHLIRAARAAAALDRRDFVLPDDVQAMVEPVLAHRLLLHPEAALTGEPTATIAARLLADVVARTPIPRPGSVRPPRRGL